MAFSRRRWPGRDAFHCPGMALRKRRTLCYRPNGRAWGAQCSVRTSLRTRDTMLICEPPILELTLRGLKGAEDVCEQSCDAPDRGYGGLFYPGRPRGCLPLLNSRNWASTPERIGPHGPAAWQHGGRKTLRCDVFVLSSGCRQKHTMITTPTLTHRGVTHSWEGM